MATHSLTVKAIEVRREGEAATTPEVNFLSYVGNTTALSSYIGLTGYQVIDEVFGNIDTSVSFGTVTAAPVITSSSSSINAVKAKKASANAVRSIKPTIKSNSPATAFAGPSIKPLKIKTIDISFSAPAPKNTDQQTSGDSRGTSESASDTSSSDNTTDSSDQTEEDLEEEESGSTKS